MDRRLSLAECSKVEGFFDGEGFYIIDPYPFINRPKS
jgi:hypothetical protein